MSFLGQTPRRVGKAVGTGLPGPPSKSHTTRQRRRLKKKKEISSREDNTPNNTLLVIVYEIVDAASCKKVSFY